MTLIYAIPVSGQEFHLPSGGELQCGSAVEIRTTMLDIPRNYSPCRQCFDVCEKCGQFDHGQTGEYPCAVCGLPLVWD